MAITTGALALGSTIIGSGGGSADGKGIIICDTSTFSVGDTIRVRDVYDSQNVQNKQVVAVGTPVIFEVDWGCYYKICTVQDIGGVLTEIGGVYKTVDYGQTLFVNALDKSTLQGMQGVLNAHNELAVYNIGDEVKTTINDGTVRDWIMQVGRIDGTNHAIDLVSKYLYQNSAMGSSGSDFYYTSSTGRTNTQAFYSKIVERDREFIKKVTKQCHIASYNSSSAYSTFDDFVWIPTNYEVFGSYPNGHTPSVAQTQLPIFTTQANRIRTLNGSATNWWTCDGLNYQDSARRFQYVGSSGGQSNQGCTTSYGLLPCFRLTADS